MMRMHSFALVVLMLAGGALAAPAPATRQQQQQQQQPGAGAIALLERARQAVDELELSEDQQAKVERIFREARAELEQMRSQLASMEVRDRLRQVREFLEGVRADLSFVLTPQQRAAMQEKLEALRDDVAAGLPPPGAVAQRLRDALPELDLTEEQKGKVQLLFEEVRAEAEALRDQALSGSVEARQKARELAQETRRKLMEILTSSQREKLREIMRGGGEDRLSNDPTPRDPRDPRDPRGRRRPARDAGDPMMSEMTMSAGAGAGAGGEMMSMEGAGADGPKTPEALATTKPAPGPAVGEAAPEFTLNRLDGAPMSLPKMKGRVIVLVFGSYSAPTFRNRAAALEDLRRDFGTRATFFIIYTREAHPTGEWEVARNRADGISVEQARSMDARKTAAQTAREALKITTPILLDTMGNDTAVAYGAGINSAYVVGRDGKIAARQQWFEPLALRRALDAATKAAP